MTPRGETALMREVLVKLTERFHPEGVFLRRNVGVAVSASGSVVRFGQPGMADIEGVFRGHHVEIETKSERGRQSPAQRRWQAAVERAGGTYLLVRTVEDAVAGIEAMC